MRVVLYAEDMEPITVLDLSGFLLEHLQEYRMVLVPVMASVQYHAMPAAPTIADMPRSVMIWAERMQRNGETHWLLFTRDEEAAMMLRSELLPGQHKEVQEREKQNYARGFLAGLNAVLR